VSRRGKTYRRVANALIRQGRELADNGRSLRALEEKMGAAGLDEEARLRELAGGIVAEVGQVMLMDAHHRSVMRGIRRLGSHIKASIRRSQIVRGRMGKLDSP
jgi:hypothetical protein